MLAAIWTSVPLPEPLPRKRKACRKRIFARLQELAAIRETKGAQIEAGWLKANCRRCGRCDLAPKRI